MHSKRGLSWRLVPDEVLFQMFDLGFVGGPPFGTPMGVAVACWIHALRNTSGRATYPKFLALKTHN
jgi:hypothetical protein